MGKVQIAVIIPVHNRKEFTLECLASLDVQSSRNFDIIVIDDGSTDGTEKVIGTEFPKCTILRGDGNLWWTKAINLGVKLALQKNYSHVLTLNNDTVADEHYIEYMSFWAEKKPRSLFGSLGIDAESKKVVYGGERIDWKTGRVSYLLNLLEEKDQKGIHWVSYFPGRGLLIPVEVFQRIGLFDQEHFPHYYADYDFTHQALKADYEIFCNYDAKLMVYPSASGSEQIRKKVSLFNYYNHLFGIKGGGNLKNFTLFALKNCPSSYLLYYLLQGYVRRIFGYWMHAVAK